MTGCNSKTVQDTCIVSIKVECEYVADDLLGDSYPPKTSVISTFCVAFHIFVVGEHRDIKFGGQVDHIKSKLMHDKPSLKGAWSYHMTEVFNPPKISLEQLKLKT